jgi:surfeit locus 1 family protein
VHDGIIRRHAPAGRDAAGSVPVSASRSTRWVGWVAALLACAVFASLGHWQLGRMQQKQAMLDDARRTLDARRARPLSSAVDATRARGYDWAAGEGRFAPAPAVLLDNQSRERRPGVRAYRLFVPDAGAPLLVELGWLPLDGDRRMPDVAAIEGARRIAGLLMPPPASGIGETASALQPDGTIVATSLAAPDLPRRLGVRALPPRVLRLDPASPLGYVRDLDILPNTLPPERHLGYAVQWFALAAAVLATAILLTVRSLRRR